MGFQGPPGRRNFWRDALFPGCWLQILCRAQSPWLGPCCIWVSANLRHSDILQCMSFNVLLLIHSSSISLLFSCCLFYLLLKVKSCPLQEPSGLCGHLTSMSFQLFQLSSSLVHLVRHSPRRHGFLPAQGKKAAQGVPGAAGGFPLSEEAAELG